MRVVFTHWGAEISQPTMLVDSCKRLGYEVWQLTDENSPRVLGVDECLRSPMTEPGMLYRCRRLSEINGEYVSLDTDMLVVRDIRDGFVDADVSLFWRARSTVVHKKTREAIDMPYNGGLIFVRDKAFMQDCYAYMRSLAPEFQGWYGDQMALRDVAPSYRVHKLTEEAWNYTPADTEDVGDRVRIYHFKGRHHKALMPHFYGRFFT